MGCLGVLFAIDDSESTILKNCKNDEELVAYVQDTIEDRWEEEWLCQTDKSWDAIHRSFADGQMELFGGKLPFNSIIFGGEILNSSSDYYVSFKTNALVRMIADKITEINKESFKRLYSKIAENYQGDKSDEDFEYTWVYFQEIRNFYIKVARSDKNVIFTVDQ
jgi:hypothetical protein